MSEREFGESWSQFWRSLSEAAGYNFPAGALDEFGEITDWLNRRPPPPELHRLTKHGGSKKDWFEIFHWTYFSDVCDGLAAAHYHLQNLEAIETEVSVRAIRNLPQHLPEKGGSIAGGNNLRMDFEYQALIFAIRRTLEYSAHSIAAYFKTEVKGFRSLAKTIGEAHSTTPEDVRDKAQAAVKNACASLTDILGREDEGWSTRDLLAHKQAVGAGTINVTRGPRGGVTIALAGGGEDISVSNPEALIPVMTAHEGDVVISGKLAPRIKERLTRQKAALVEIYTSLIQSPAN